MPNVPDSALLRHAIAAWLIAAFLLLFALRFHLLPGLLAGLLVYELVHIIAPQLRLVHAGAGKVAAVALLAVVIVAMLTLIVFGALAFFRSDAGSLAGAAAEDGRDHRGFARQPAGVGD